MWQQSRACPTGAWHSGFLGGAFFVLASEGCGLEARLPDPVRGFEMSMGDFKGNNTSLKNLI